MLFVSLNILPSRLPREIQHRMTMTTIPIVPFPCSPCSIQPWKKKGYHITVLFILSTPSSRNRWAYSSGGEIKYLPRVFFFFSPFLLSVLSSFLNLTLFKHPLGPWISSYITLVKSHLAKFPRFPCVLFFLFLNISLSILVLHFLLCLLFTPFHFADWVGQ